MFCIGIWIGDRISSKKCSAKLRKERLSQTIIDLMRYRTTLVEVREGRTPTAVEMLEYSTDTAVSMLSHQMDGASEPLRERAIEALKATKSYRERWPRQVNAQLILVDNTPFEDVQPASEDASKVLASVVNR